jgi:Flp pilus assembly pilin Flp
MSRTSQGPARSRRRGERGATTAEYVGMVALVALLVVATLAFVPNLGSDARTVADRAFCRIGEAIGLGGCEGGEEQPAYVPRDCTISSHEGVAGGSVAILAEVKGESGYKLSRVREVQDDGSIATRFEVRTQGVVGGGYEFTLGGGAEASTGSGSASAKAAATAELEGDVTWGKQYEFASEEAARAFIDEFKGNFGEFGREPEGAPPASSEYFEVGAGATVRGEVGPAEASVSQRGVVGVENYPDGGRKVSLVMSADAAVELGIPVPDSVLKLGAEGSVSAMVAADLTFDAQGNVSAVAGSVQLTPTAAAGVEWRTELAEPSTGRHAKPETLQGLTLPPILRLDYGRNYEINFSTDFAREDGSYEYAAIEALSAQLGSWATGGGDLSPEHRAALTEQLNEHSQITYNEYDYSRDEQRYGGKVKVLFVKVGGEVHVTTVDQNLTAGYYYDPVQGQWAENIVCQS